MLLGGVVREMTESLGWKRKVNPKVTLVDGVNITYRRTTWNSYRKKSHYGRSHVDNIDKHVTESKNKVLTFDVYSITTVK